MANKVLFGFKNLYIGTYSVSTTGVVTLATPYHQAGAVGFSPDTSANDYDFYADDIPYYSDYSDGPIEGDLEVAMFDDAVKTSYMGYAALTGGGIAQVKGAIRPNIYLAAELEGDAEKRRVLFLNGKFGPITRSYQTKGETVEVQTETAPVKFVGDNNTGVTMATYKPTDTGYSNLFTSPTVPTLAT